MKASRNVLVATAMIVLFLGCRTAVPQPAISATRTQNDLLNATVWFQTSAEANALKRQIFVAGRAALDRAIADPAWTAADEQTGDFGGLPPAVIVDIDETVLDNSALEARLIKDQVHYSDELWSAWVEERKATAIPGAVEFARHAAERGVTMFYVTNRTAAEEAATRDNLKKVGFPVDEKLDVVLSRGENGASSDKASRRAIVANTHRILLVFGDDLGDFTAKDGSVDDRLRRVERFDGRWGTSWFVLPNPMYGSWERAYPATGPSGDDAHARKMDALDDRRD